MEQDLLNRRKWRYILNVWILLRHLVFWRRALRGSVHFMNAAVHFISPLLHLHDHYVKCCKCHAQHYDFVFGGRERGIWNNIGIRSTSRRHKLRSVYHNIWISVYCFWAILVPRYSIGVGPFLDHRCRRFVGIIHPGTVELAMERRLESYSCELIIEVSQSIYLRCMKLSYRRIRRSMTSFPLSEKVKILNIHGVNPLSLFSLQ